MSRNDGGGFDIETGPIVRPTCDVCGGSCRAGETYCTGCRDTGAAEIHTGMHAGYESRSYLATDGGHTDEDDTGDGDE